MTTPSAPRAQRRAWTVAVGLAVVVAAGFSATPSAALDRRPTPVQGSKGSDLMPKGGNASRALGAFLGKFRVAPRQVSEIKTGGKKAGGRRPAAR